MMNITNEDNMELMARYPDNHFELAIVDPPFGINISKTGILGNSSFAKKEWDVSIPTKDYFKELFRVSKNQIIWGGNYMTEFLEPKSSWIIWDKLQPEDFTMAMGELAWTSFDSPIKIFKKGVRGGFLTNGTINHRIHPTQKPVQLYKWILDKYAKQGDKILDTHLGSGSIAIAAHDYGFDLTACELDREYFDKAMERINNHVAQQKLF
jgi:site-specific DNA-methyltransferase (adenine-specific)